MIYAIGTLIVALIVFYIGRLIGRNEGAVWAMIMLQRDDDDDDDHGGEDEPAPLLPPKYIVGQRWSAKHGLQ